MCEPISLGIASAASGIAGSVGQYQSGQAAANAQNAATRRQFKDLERQRYGAWQREQLKFGYQKVKYEQERSNIYDAYGGAVADKQLALNEAFKKAAFNNQAQIQELLKSQGQLAARGRTGRSAERLNDSMLGQFGRNQAIQAETLASARQGYMSQVDKLRNAMRSDLNKAYGPVAIRPVPGVAPSPPTMVAGPSALGLAAGIGSSIVGGFSTYNSLKAPTTEIPGLPSMNTGLPLNG